MRTNQSSSSPVSLVDIEDTLYDVTCRFKALEHAITPVINQAVSDDISMGFYLMFRDALDAMEAFEAQMTAALKALDDTPVLKLVKAN